MNPLYIANPDHTLGYGGNKIYKPLKKISGIIATNAFENRLSELRENKFWYHIVRINHRINKAANDYFNDLGSQFALLPLTTRMISSPGAIYGKEHIDYTSDTVPIKLKWFDLDRDVFLAESSQIYLELYLMINGIDSVYSIYNSFRKEPADHTHLSEFHHIEYEGKVSQAENKKIILNLLARIAKELLSHNKDDLAFFLEDDDIDELKRLADKRLGKEITFEQALDILYMATKDEKYKKFSTQNFGTWEEVKLTSELDDMAIISEFPLYEVAFYHAPISRSGSQVAENTDFIWPYYREVVGCGHRVRSLDELLKKAKVFNLPLEDYKYYLESRKSKNYKETSGFGVGWERLLQGMLKMPYIYSASTFPRVHSTIYP
ncbi:MAG: asparagine--tRNA ligase [Candidatus Marsarchaeota archaeon]|jgi:aspartyl/asparaginyl-tRNA synthetase|nr:asparagine--tRNA ligase [Candidatus Marsarchaeota archaeon]MCL5111866.1 asparagine--tRNA ligase [Candidatus Marsarchaeota archaeon]